MEHKLDLKKYAKIAKQAAAESCVLLKNEKNTLPLRDGDKVAVFGRCALHYYKSGLGSGGLVNTRYVVSILDALKECENISIEENLLQVYEDWSKENPIDEGCGWGTVPWSQKEMPLTDDIVAVAKDADVALVIIGRTAGEDQDNEDKEGSYRLTEDERNMVAMVSKAFERTVVLLNVGNIIDMSWVEEYNPAAVMYVWQGGQEGGNGVVDVLTGKVNPCGKMTDTIAYHIDDYPSTKNFGDQYKNYYEEDIYVGYRYFETFAREKILYSFGYGLSYTTFDVMPLSYHRQGVDDYFEISVRVTNTGKLPGKEVVQLYMEAPQGVLGREKRSLLAFQKTEELAPSISQDLVFKVPLEQLAAFDDTGKTGYKNTYVLEKGDYWYFFGVSNENGRFIFRNAGGTAVKETRVFRHLEEICPVQQAYERVVPVEQTGRLMPGKEIVPAGTVNMKHRITESLPEEIPVTGDVGIHFSEVQKKNAPLEAFVAQLSDEELEALTRGEGGMDRPLGVGGNTGIYGGFLPSLIAKGVPVLVTADGPAGLRIKRYTSLLPCGTSLACTWNENLVERLFEKMAEELERFEVDILLSPGLNIHRNPLCGRNFEYFSEDPYISGKMAAAAVRGIQSRGRSACPKHFACNNQEVNRHHNDSRVSERALREIYLRGFEICVKESNPKNIMTSYNKVNGVWSHYNFDLASTVLRGEWKYEGVIMTDWWMQKSASPEFPEMRDNAYRVRAGVDVLMPGGVVGSRETEYKSDGTLLETLGKPEGITRAELQQTAMHVLSFAMTKM